MTIYSNFGSKEGLLEALVQDRTERVMGGSGGVEGLDPMRPGKALLAVGEQFLALTREEQTLGRFRSLHRAANAQPEARKAIRRRGRSG